MSNSLKLSGNPICQNINHLPDAILHHVLSFLPTKEAVATSVLSKRWHSLWTWVRVLDFEDSPSCETNEKQRIDFMHFVYRALILNRAVSLDKFRLNCDIIHGPSCLNAWIDGAIRKDIVQEVDISVSATQKSHFLKLPSCVFTTKNLKVLKLSKGILIDVPNSMSVCFPSLKVLHLDFVEYANNDSVSRLLQGCTVLEELLVNRSFRDNVRNFIISVPTLKTLNISELLEPKNLLEYFSHSYHYELTINAPNLEYLEIIDLESLVHLESVFVSLIKANISFHGTGLFQLAKALCNAKFLFLKWTCCGNSRASLENASFPLFLNLTQLELHSGFEDWDVIPHFLDNSPNLEVLVLENPIIMRNKQECFPKCLSPHLRKVLCRGFEGCEHELKMVEYILMNARALELIEICSSFDMSFESKFALLQKLSKFPRRSETCQLTFK
ncbi:F-box protein At4g09920-like [Durio zibethinus]|uniref:F-box protein At4g09920-like n=1 Tax=Durio zibethinus TaxID=66656 RepID=A0A6P5WMK2_DURZI|nr:F-box protein At4g09920-like [Durio zibethinus]XP_022717104.1 F-box protein At4g09920-like [Durio zibethinus]